MSFFWLQWHLCLFWHRHRLRLSQVPQQVARSDDLPATSELPRCCIALFVGKVDRRPPEIRGNGVNE